MGQGTFEIERRYLIRIRPGLLEGAEGHAYRQGYVLAGDPSVRIRVGEPRGPVLAFKAGKGIRRREVEEGVGGAMAEALLEAAGDRVLEKTRYRLGPWELDRYGGALEGLTVLEIELDHADAPVPPAPDGVEVLGEVTFDKRFIASYLASMTQGEQRALVAQAYREVEG